MGKSEEQHESDVAANIHHGVDKDTEGGKCLNRHEAAWKEHSCSHRWQGYKHALKDRHLYNYPAYKELVDRGKRVRTDALEDHTSAEGTLYPIFPPGYTFLLDAPAENAWDVSGKETSRNFKWDSRTPYLHNSHHCVSNSKLREAIDKSEKKFSGFTLVVRKGLTGAGYNINHQDNMVILPMDTKVANVLSLPRHLITTLHRDHVVYSKHVASELKTVMQTYEQQLSEYFKNKDKEHLEMAHELCKTGIETLAKVLYTLITARLSKKEWKKVGVDFNGTLDSLVG
jgi:hypothetical protein